MDLRVTLDPIPLAGPHEQLQADGDVPVFRNGMQPLRWRGRWMRGAGLRSWGCAGMVGVWVVRERVWRVRVCRA